MRESKGYNINELFKEFKIFIYSVQYSFLFIKLL